MSDFISTTMGVWAVGDSAAGAVDQRAARGFFREAVGSSAGVGLDQPEQESKKACAKSEAERDAHYDGQKEKEEVHGGGGSFRDLWGTWLRRRPRRFSPVPVA